MKEDNIEKLLSNDFSLYSLTVKSANADLKETGRNFHYRGSDLRSLIMLLRKRFSSIEPNQIRLVRQIPKNTAAAEAIVVNTPNGQTFLCFGSQKFREQLEEAVYVGLYYPDLFPKLIVDNLKFYEKLKYFCKRKPNSPKGIHSEVVRILLILHHYFGTRSVGGWTTSHITNLKIVRKLPRRPKKKVFRRGYDDKGQLAPDCKLPRIQANEVFYDKLIKMNTIFNTLQSLYVETISFDGELFRASIFRKPGYGWDDDEIEEEQEVIQKVFRILTDFTEVYQLDPREVARELTTLRSQG